MFKVQKPSNLIKSLFLNKHCNRQFTEEKSNILFSLAQLENLQFYIESYYIKWATTFWTHSSLDDIFQCVCPLRGPKVPPPLHQLFCLILVYDPQRDHIFITSPPPPKVSAESSSNKSKEAGEDISVLLHTGVILPFF